jgi:hypothetical protein
MISLALDLAFVYKRLMPIEKEDVTEKVDFQNNDDETLPLTKCVCGAVFRPWDQFISIYPETPWTCPECGAKLFFQLGIRVFRVREDHS